MRGYPLLAGVAAAVSAFALGASLVWPVLAEDAPGSAAPASQWANRDLTPAQEPSDTAPAAPDATGQDQGQAAQAPEETAPPPEATPVVASIRTKIAAQRKASSSDDLVALEAFYNTRGDALWMTNMGFSGRGLAAIDEVLRADDWGLSRAAFELPPAGDLPKSPDDAAASEIKLDLAILKYARYARGGRTEPAKLNKLFGVSPTLRDPKTVLAEIAGAEATDAYLRSLHPKHEQFQRLHQALLKARAEREAGANAPNTQKIVVNMERWRWMPEDLGAVYVWNNSPEFMLYVMKDGKPIYADKTLVGTLNYATPVFTADMKTIVFNPDWIAPETVVKENVWPQLRKQNYSILRVHKLQVSYNGNRIDPERVDWNRVNPLSYTFLQKAGPGNNLGKIKFLYPNRHTVYMHDTLPVRKKYFKSASRLIGHECVRMEKPQSFAEVLLAEDKGWTAAQVKELWDKGNNSAITIERSLPVHMVYFTAVADDKGKVSTFADVYGLDRKLAAALFGNASGFPPPPPDTSKPPPSETGVSRPASSGSRTASGSGIAGSIGGFFED